MSSILESLNKSQQQRATNAVGGQQNWRFGAHRNDSPDRRKRALRLLAGVIVLLALLAWLFSAQLQQLWTNSASSEPPAALPGMNMATATRQPPAQSADTYPTQTTNPLTTQNRSFPDERALPRPDPNQNRAALKARREQTDRPQALTAQKTPQTQNSQPDVMATTENAPANGTDKSSTVDEAIHPVASGHNRQAIASGGRKKDLRDTPPHQAERKNGFPRQQYRYLYQLPLAMRKQLPALKLNIHVYDQNPKHRLVVINGEDLGIGDSLEGSHITVKDILPDGALIEADGEMFLLPTRQ